MRVIWVVRLRGIRLRHVRREDVACEPYRFDEAGLARVRLDLLAHAADVNVDAALDRSGHPAVGEVEQSLTREDLPRVPAEGEQQIELGARPRAVRFNGWTIDPTARQLRNPYNVQVRIRAMSSRELKGLVT
jgi:hypothetical protein